MADDVKLINLCMSGALEGLQKKVRSVWILIVRVCEREGQTDALVVLQEEKKHLK